MKTLTSLFFVLFLSITTIFGRTSDLTEVIAVGDSIQNTLNSVSIHAYEIELGPDRDSLHSHSEIR